jgi:hypothetical protein
LKFQIPNEAETFLFICLPGFKTLTKIREIQLKRKIPNPNGKVGIWNFKN